MKFVTLVSILALATCMAQAQGVEPGKHAKKHHAVHAQDQFSRDREIIRELIQEWALYRDACLWDDFRKVWHEDGRMTASWSQSGYETFIKNSQAGVDRGGSILHLLGGSAIKVNGNRAVSMTKMNISQRDKVDGILCDVNCLARHYDFWEKRDGRWGLVLRESIYDKARIDTVNPNDKLVIDEKLWNQFPKEYAALAYLQEKIGGHVKRGMPAGYKSDSLTELYARGADWLSGKRAKAWNE